LSIAFVLTALAGCDPFLPDTGEPIIATPLGRSTPKGVIDQLMDSYTGRRIDLFEDLFPDDKSFFRFYISPRLVETGSRIVTTSEQFDTLFTYVPQGVYYYWPYEDEHRSHQRIFSAATSISISTQPVYDQRDFVYHYGPGGDTIGVEVLMLGGEILIKVPDPVTPRQELWYYIVIDRQVFYLVRDSERNWVIKKWFDFGTSAGDPS